MPNRPDVYARWLSEMRRGEVFRPGERVGVAVSGGPDSVLLLDFLQRLSQKIALRLVVVHFNHHLRGAESDTDESFVRGLARERGLELIRGEAEVERVAREKHRNLEATARELRYRFFFSLVSRRKLDKVATAHTANDQAETVLLRLLRGTGTRGLGGIYPALEGKVVRPFLALTRAEIEGELKARKLDYRVDSTNRDPRRQRNKIRMELLPLLEKEFNPEVVTLLKELADRARDDEQFLEQQTRELAQAWRVREGEEERIPGRPMLEFPPAVARRVLRQMILAARGNLRGITHAHIEALRRFAATAQSGRSMDLSGNLVARKEFDWLVLGHPTRGPAGTNFAYPVKLPGEVAVAPLGLTFRFKIVAREGAQRAYNGHEVVVLDAQRLSEKLVLRNWRPGDRFQPPGSRKPLKLKELFRLRRIPLGQRKLWPVLESGGEIVWVRGFPAASSAAATPNSKQVVILGEDAEAAGGAR